MNTRARAGFFVAVVSAVVALVAMPAGSAAVSATAVKGPTIKSFTPTKGTAGTSVKIRVANLPDATQVAFNGVPAQSFTVDSAQQITAVVAGGTTTGKITITTTGGIVTSKKPFTVATGQGGKQLWQARYNGVGKKFDNPIGAVSSPDGSTVYVTGEEWAGQDWGFVTIAYKTANGAQRWRARWDGGGLTTPGPSALALSPDGRRLVVGGYWQFGSAMIVYDAATGQELWSATSATDASLPHRTAAVAVSPDNATIFLTGYRIAGDANFAYDYDTVAFDAATGARLWTATYDGPDNGADEPVALAVSPDGTKVFVTGASGGYGTVAYDAATGDQLWVAHYDGETSAFIHLNDAAAMAVSHDGTKVFVTGRSCDSTCDSFDYVTVAYGTADGAQLWVSRYSGPFGDDMPRAIVVTPDSSRVVVTGSSAGSEYPSAVTVAYSATTGASLWESRPTPDVAAYGNAIGVSPDGTKIFVTGSRVAPTVHDEFATLAYDALTGNSLWSTHFTFPATDTWDQAFAEAVPDGSKVVVTGFIDDGTQGGNGRDWLTVAYSS